MIWIFFCVHPSLISCSFSLFLALSRSLSLYLDIHINRIKKKPRFDGLKTIANPIKTNQHTKWLDMMNPNGELYRILIFIFGHFTTVMAFIFSFPPTPFSLHSLGALNILRDEVKFLNHKIDKKSEYNKFQIKSNASNRKIGIRTYLKTGSKEKKLHIILIGFDLIRKN